LLPGERAPLEELLRVDRQVEGEFVVRVQERAPDDDRRVEVGRVQDLGVARLRSQRA
jgi:hypothetical protein